MQAQHAQRAVAQAQAAQQDAQAAQAELQQALQRAQGLIEPAQERAERAEEDLEAAQAALHDALAAQGHLQVLLTCKKPFLYMQMSEALSMSLLSGCMRQHTRNGMCTVSMRSRGMPVIRMVKLSTSARSLTSDCCRQP